MSPVGATHSLVIETRRTVRAKADALENDKPVNRLQADLETGDRKNDGSFDAKRPRNLCRPEAERDVPFRYSLGASRLDTAFVAQLIGQTMPERAARCSDVLAAYEQLPASALICDRRL